jgi:hypothetical protein
MKRRLIERTREEVQKLTESPRRVPSAPFYSSGVGAEQRDSDAQRACLSAEDAYSMSAAVLREPSDYPFTIR